MSEMGKIALLSVWGFLLGMLLVLIYLQLGDILEALKEL